MLMMDFPRFESNDKKGFLLVNVPPSLWPMLPESQLKLMPTLSRQWEGLSAEAKDLIQGLLNKDPVARYSAKQVATHSWFKG
jgi:serine/threonine protein kinase